MAAISDTTPVGAPIAQHDDADTYPTHLASRGKGGLRTVANLTERNNIPSEQREVGMEVYVGDTGSGIPGTYYLDADLFSWSAVYSDLRSLSAASGIMVDTIALLTALDSSSIFAAGTVVQTRGYWTVGDGGGNQFYYDASDTTTTVGNGGSVIIDEAARVWKQLDPFNFNVLQFGAKRSDNSNATEAIQAALTATVAASGTLHIPQGYYTVYDTLSATGERDVSRQVKIKGFAGVQQGTNFATILSHKVSSIYAGTTNKPVFDFIGQVGVTIEDLQIHGAGGSGAPSVGVLLGRIDDNQNGGTHRFTNVRFVGCFKIACVYAISTEMCYYTGCEFHLSFVNNTADGGTAFYLAKTANSIYGTVTSPTVLNITTTGNYGVGCNTFVHCAFNNTSTGTAGSCMVCEGVQTLTLLGCYTSLHHGLKAIIFLSHADGVMIDGLQQEFRVENYPGTAPPPGLAFESTGIFRNIRVSNAMLLPITSITGATVTSLRVQNMWWNGKKATDSGMGGVGQWNVDVDILNDSVVDVSDTTASWAVIQVKDGKYRIRTTSSNNRWIINDPTRLTVPSSSAGDVVAGAGMNLTIGFPNRVAVDTDTGATSNTALLLRANGTLNRVKVGASGTLPGGETGKVLYVV